MATKKEARKFIAPKLVTRLTGPARLLAMGWNQQDLQGKGGLQIYMAKLSESPLVRRKLPNTAAVMQQYFSFKRHGHEAIANFLVREALHFEEFVEALHLLKDEKDGKAEEIFLPEETSSEEETGSQSSGGKNGRKKEEPVDPAQSPTRSQTRSSHGGEPTTTRTSTSSLDSFILEQLRGWRLLTAAALSPEEWRSVLASTGNKLDYTSVVSSLEILYDEHFNRGRHHQGLTHYSPRYSHFGVEEEDWWHWDDGWNAWAGWEDEEMWSIPETTEESEKSTIEEKTEGEAMAMDQGRTWAQAQRATQVMRKDRGFGGAMGQGRPVSGCFICGNPGHLARDCPDRLAPGNKGKSFGKGKSLHYVDGYDDYQIYGMGMKGKSKGKAKGKSSLNWMEPWEYAAAFIPKGKGKKGFAKSSGNVNNYYMGQDIYDYHGLEMESPELEIQSSQMTAKPGSSSTAFGMMDTGATCSAGPEQSIKNMMDQLLAKDPKAKITIDGRKRPRFRYGSGDWGRALYHITLESSSTGRTFGAYALNDPAEKNQPWFTQQMLVPVLVGMDFIRGVGMVIDFNDGCAVCTCIDEGEHFFLPTNNKGHYMVDIVQYLTAGQTVVEGNPHIHVIEPDSDENVTGHARELTGLEFYPLTFEGHGNHEALTLASEGPSKVFMKMVERRRSMTPSTQQSQLMGCSHTDYQQDLREHASQEDREEGAKEGGGVRLGARDPSGSQRSQDEINMALQRKPHSDEMAQQQVGTVAALRSVRFAPEVRADQGSSKQLNPSGQPDHGAEGDRRLAEGVERERPSHGGDGSGDDGEVERRGASEGAGAGEGDQIRAEDEDHELHCAEDRQAQGRDAGELGELGDCEYQPADGKLIDGQPHGLSHDRGAQPDDADCARADGSSGYRGDRGQRHGAGAGETMSVETEEVGHALPLRIGKAAMSLIHSMTEKHKEDVAEVVYEGKIVTWEMFCSPASGLSEACKKQGFHAVRIGLSTDFDLYKPDTYILHRAAEPLRATKTSSHLGESHVHQLLRLE